MVILPGDVTFSRGGLETNKYPGFFFGRYNDLNSTGSEKIAPESAKHYYEGSGKINRPCFTQPSSIPLTGGETTFRSYTVNSELEACYNLKNLNDYTVYFLKENVVPKIQAPEIFSTLYPRKKYAIVDEAEYIQKLVSGSEDVAVSYYSTSTGRLFIFAPKTHEFLFFLFKPSYAIGWDAYYLKILAKKICRSKKITTIKSTNNKRPSDLFSYMRRLYLVFSH